MVNASQKKEKEKPSVDEGLRDTISKKNQHFNEK